MYLSTQYIDRWQNHFLEELIYRVTEYWKGKATIDELLSIGSKIYFRFCGSGNALGVFQRIRYDYLRFYMTPDSFVNTPIANATTTRIFRCIKNSDPDEIMSN